MKSLILIIYLVSFVNFSCCNDKVQLNEIIAGKNGPQGQFRHLLQAIVSNNTNNTLLNNTNNNLLNNTLISTPKPELPFIEHWMEFFFEENLLFTAIGGGSFVMLIIMILIFCCICKKGQNLQEEKYCPVHHYDSQTEYCKT